MFPSLRRPCPIQTGRQEAPEEAEERCGRGREEAAGENGSREEQGKGARGGQQERSAGPRSPRCPGAVLPKVVKIHTKYGRGISINID